MYYFMDYKSKSRVLTLIICYAYIKRNWFKSNREQQRKNVEAYEVSL